MSTASAGHSEHHKDHAGHEHYYVPHGTRWPIVGSIGLFTLMGGTAIWLNDVTAGKWLTLLGFLLVIGMMVGWFGTVIGESEGGLYGKQVDSSFRWGMSWFIFSEVMFFAVFFGTLFYARQLVLPWLAGEGDNFYTHLLLWPSAENAWPSTGPLNPMIERVSAWGIPTLNTGLLLASGVTLTIGHHALRANHRGQLIFWLAATFILGFVFLGMQVKEYLHLYLDENVRLDTGIYGNTFFFLTGFHGLHVTLGAIMLLVIWLRVLRGHFTAQRHFAFEAVAWYWHFVDVVWLGLFFFVYWV